MKKSVKLFLTLMTSLLFIAACTSPTNESNSDFPPSNTNEDQIEIITSIFPMYEIVKEVAGDRANVSLMVGSNEDAHHYEPSAQAIANVNEADVFVYSSDVMEFWVSDLLDVVENDALKVIEYGEDLNLEIEESKEHALHGEEAHDDHDHDHAHDHGGLDPHFWLNLVAVNNQLPKIVETLSEVDPDGAEYYEENAEMFSNRLLTLDQEYLEAFADATNRVFVVQHQAFGHLADRYHLEQVAVGGLSTEVEASPKALAEIIDFVNEQEVPVIYYQSGGNSAVAETIANETNTEIAVLYDLESQPADLESDGNVYLEAMTKNLEQLKKSIQ